MRNHNLHHSLYDGENLSSNLDVINSIFIMITSDRNKMFDIENICGANMTKKLQFIGIRIYILYNIQKSDFSGYKVVVPSN